MRALARSAATLLAIVACGPNPYFKLAGESNDGGASSTGREATSADVSTSNDVSASSEPEPAPDLPPCDPPPVTETLNYIEDKCGIAVLPKVPPSMALETMLADVDCGTQSRHFIKRMTPTEFWECPENCDGTCDSTRTINISNLDLLPNIDAQLPQLGLCARLLHVSKLDENNVCTSTGYAFWDTDGAQQLRLAAAAEYDPFTGIPELEIDVAPARSGLCPRETDCQIEDVAILRVALDGCFFEAPQNGEWQDIRFGGREYRFSSSAYTCTYPPGPPVIGWYLRRQQL